MLKSNPCYRYAYVDFENAKQVERIVKLSEQHLDGRRLLIKSNNDFTGRPASQKPTASSVQAILGAPANPISASAAKMEVDAKEDEGKAKAKAKRPEPVVSLSKTARKIIDQQKNPVGPTLFLGNLGFETTVCQSAQFICSAKLGL